MAKSDWRRRAALNIVSSLPDNAEDAIKILELSKELVQTWLLRPAADQPVNLIAFSSDSASSAALRRSETSPLKLSQSPS